MGVQYLTSTPRWAVLQALADADEPLTRPELAERSGVKLRNVHQVLIRPQRMGWVSSTPFTIPHAPNGWGSTGLRYEITDLGRQALAEHIKES